MITIADVLAQAQQIGVVRLDAQLLLGHVLDRPRQWLIAHDEMVLNESQVEAITSLIQRRHAGEPLAYLTGEREFHGLMLSVNPKVLIPRPDTETLVDWALSVLQSSPDLGRVLDMGTGSGAIALAIKHRQPAACVTAVDVSPQALEVAAGNARRLGLEVQFLVSDWWSELAGSRFDLIVSNPPYIALGDPHLAALRFEPESALTSGADGLDALRMIVTHAPEHLEAGGWLLLEHGHDQPEAVQQLLRKRGFTSVQTHADLAGIGRCTGGKWS